MDLFGKERRRYPLPLILSSSLKSAVSFPAERERGGKKLVCLQPCSSYTFLLLSAVTMKMIDHLSFLYSQLGHPG